MEFKESCLFRDLSELKDKGILSENAWGFIDACTDDWKVTYKIDFQSIDTTYTLKTMLSGYFWGKEISVETIYKGNLMAMCSLIEHLAHTEELLFRERGMGVTI